MATYLIEGGKIEVIDRRRLGINAVIPAYVFDLYLPILGFVGIGAYATIVRLTSGIQSWNKLLDYARAGRIGIDRFNRILEILVELQFIEVTRPAGNDKARHRRTVIALLDPPTQVPDQYVELVRGLTIAKWLFEDRTVQTELPISLQELEDEDGPMEAVPIERTISIDQQIVVTFRSMLPEAWQGVMNWGQERRAAKQIVAYAKTREWDNETTLQAVVESVREMLADEFWAKKPFNLYSVLKHKLPVVEIKEHAVGEELDEAPAIDETTLHPEWRIITMAHPAFWKEGTRLPLGEGGVMECVVRDGRLMYVRDGTDEVVLTHEMERV